jgi:TonB family protein
MENQPGQPAAPRIVSGLDAGTLARFYPSEAEKRGVDGFVTVAVTLDSDGHATDPQILSETPLDMGFAAAAASLACTLSYSNPTGAPVVFKFAVKFALDRARPQFTPPPQPAQSTE